MKGYTQVLSQSVYSQPGMLGQHAEHSISESKQKGA